MQWRWSVIAAWIALVSVVFLGLGSTALRSWGLLMAFGVVPPMMLLWLWNEDRPLLLGTLRERSTRVK